MWPSLREAERRSNLGQAGAARTVELASSPPAPRNDPSSIGSGLPGKSLRGQTVEILAPAFLMFYAELVEVIPRIDPGIVEIVEGDTDSVIADRFNTDDADMGPTVHERLLSRTMALHFGGWALDTQILRGQGKMAAVVECNIEQFFRSFEAQLQRPARRAARAHETLRATAGAWRRSRRHAGCAPPRRA